MQCEDARIQKRPMLHPPIPSPYSGAAQQKVVYISAKTPFVSALKRVRKHLSLIDKRSTGKVDLINGKGSDKQKLRALGENESDGKGKEPEEVVLKATGKAIEKALNLALFFQGQQDCKVRLRTGGVGVVDDIVEADEPVIAQTEIKIPSLVASSIASNTLQGVDNDRMEEGDSELPETQIRKTSMLEVGISLL